MSLPLPTGLQENEPDEQSAEADPLTTVQGPGAWISQVDRSPQLTVHPAAAHWKPQVSPALQVQFDGHAWPGAPELEDAEELEDEVELVPPSGPGPPEELELPVPPSSGAGTMVQS